MTYLSCGDTGREPVERYPEENKAATLMQALKDARRSWNRQCVTRAFYIELSEAIHQLVELAGSDPYLIRDWVWTTAQLRIAHPDDEPAARTAWGGLTVFLVIMSRATSHDVDLLRNLRWLTDHVVEDLIQATGPHAVERYVSAAEHKRIEDLLLELAESAEPDLQTLLSSAQRVVTEFSSIHHSAYFPSVADKLRGLAGTAADETEAGYWARAALRYVHLEQDVFDDGYGYIGYLDDIQVIQDVHDLVHGALSWRPLLEHAIANWPMLSRIHWMDGKTTNHLAPFPKATAACALQAVLDVSRERLIVTPEVGPLGFVSAALCALADLKAEARSGVPSPGTVVTFREGHLTRFVVMEQPYDAGEGVELPMARVRNGTISIPAQYAALLEPAAVEDPQLATKRQVDQWVKSVDADLLTPVWRYRRAEVRPSVVYVTDRSRFFAAMDQVRPFGWRLDELVPVAYHTRGARTAIGSGAATTVPAMIVCNDLATAEVSLKLGAAENRLPRYVITDRTIDPDSLRGLSYRCLQLDPEIRIVTFATPDIARSIRPDERDISIWLIRPDDIDQIPTDPSSQGARKLGQGPLATFNRRQVTARIVDFQNVLVELEELDCFASLAGRVARRAARAKDRELELIAIASEAALRQISGQPPLGERLLNDRIQATLANVQALAGVYGLYDTEVAGLAPASAALAKKLKAVHPKDGNLRALLEQHPDSHVLVSSRAVADEMNECGWAGEGRRPRFVAIHELELAGDISVLIVPSWFGTREMRRLQFGGWAPLQIRVLFPYEIRRLETLNHRLVRNLRSLAQRTRKSWRSFSDKNPDVKLPPGLPEEEERAGQEREVREARNVEERGDSADWLETVIRNRVTAFGRARGRRGIVNARLVFFDDGRHFGIFARDASLICLNEILGDGSDLSQIGESEAERLLWKKVNALTPGDVLAFPDDPLYADVIDGLADALIGDQGETRRLAGLWRVAVRAVVERCEWDLEHAQQCLAKAGVEREISTLASWLYSTKTVAPKRPAETIPALLSCAAMDNLKGREQEILKAAAAVYAARRKAGQVLVTNLSSASISAWSGTAHVEVAGAQVRYRLLTVATVDGVAPFSSGVLGLHTTEDELREAAA